MQASRFGRLRGGLSVGALALLMAATPARAENLEQIQQLLLSVGQPSKLSA